VKKFALFFTVMTLSASAYAIDMKDISGAIGKFDEVGKCMKQVDQDAVMAVKNESESVNREIKRLCEADRSNDARKVALEFAKKMAADPEIEKIRKCASLIGQDVPGLPEIPGPEELENRDICDQPGL
jgi:hypothetical protein